MHKKSIIYKFYYILELKFAWILVFDFQNF